MKPALVRTLRRPVVLCLLAAAVLAAGLIAWRAWPRRYLRQGEEALAAREYDTARERLAKYLSYRPDDARARLLAARAARRLGEYYEAGEHLRRCREAGGDLEAVRVETALIGVQRGAAPSADLRLRAEFDDELALAILEVVIQHDIDTYRLRQAQAGLTQYLRSRPDDLQALLARGYVGERFLNFADALQDYKKAVAAHPDSEPARRKLAETLLIAGTPAEALEQYQWLAARRPERREVRLGLAQCRRRLGEADEAAKLLDGLLAEARDDGEALWERGQLEMDRGRSADAERWLRQAVRARPHDRRIAYSLSRCLAAQGKAEEAATVAARVAEIDADLRRLAKVSQAVMARPDDAELRVEGARLFMRNGERQEGLRWLRLALRLDPTNKAAREALAAAEAGGPEGR